MSIYLSTAFIPLAAILPPLILILAIIWDRRHRNATEKPPTTDKFLRPPGYSLSIQLNEKTDGILFKLLEASSLSVCAAMGVQLVVLIFRTNAPLSWLVACVVFTGICLGACVVCLRRGFDTYQEALDFRLGLRGEQAVAEALNEVTDAGFRSFHDFPAGDDWNIDHIAVGPRGVFLIETKARRRRGSRPGQASHEVLYDGEALLFPTYRDTKPIDQARRNARWLAEHLTKHTGEKVEVAPLVVLPGWYVKYSENRQFPIKVMNTTYITGFLEGQGEKIEPAQVRRIIARLDEKCRDLEF